MGKKKRLKRGGLGEMGCVDFGFDDARCECGAPTEPGSDRCEACQEGYLHNSRSLIMVVDERQDHTSGDEPLPWGMF